MSAPFIKTEKQTAACNTLNTFEHALLFGGSRSGKTTIIVRNIILRAIKKKSRHLICRFRFNHVKQSIGMDTLPKVMEMCFPEMKGKWRVNKSDWFITIDNAEGSTSEIWLGGVDDKDRVEKILGNEYSTIYLNECSQIDYEAVVMLYTRLAENSGLKLKFYYDLNPCGKKHWSYKQFVEGLAPGTREPHAFNTGYLILNPFDNQENLPYNYLQILEALPLRQRQRFLDGQYLNDVEGALWTDEMVSNAKVHKTSEPIKTVIAVDPAVTYQEDSDETGIIPCSIDEFGNGIVHDDLSLKASTKTWAQRAVNAYHDYEANCIVVETNQGGDLVEDAIKAIDKKIKVVQVKASKGKFARAEPVSELYELGRVRHEKDMPDLEAQMTEWVPLNSKKSPDRLDALVWGLTYLMLKKHERTVRAMVV